MTEKLHVFGTECMGYHDTESLGNSVGETENQKHQAARRTDGGQCILPKILAYDHGVYHVVELLEQISKQNRKGKRRMIFIGFPIVMSFLIVKSPLPLIHL